MIKRTLLFLIVAVTVLAQPTTRRATNIAALVSYAGYFHLRPIVVIGKVTTEQNGAIRVADDEGGIRLVVKGSAPDGVDEVRGEFWDLGRLKPDEPRLASYDLKRTFNVDPEGAWPRPGEVTAIMATAVAPAQPPAAPSIRTIVLYPARYLDQKVTITGQFGGRNLFGDLPDAPAKSRYDFVLRAADAAIWVSGAQPKGKGFNLSLDARLDTGRWLEVMGTVRHGRGLQWIEAAADSLQLGKPPTETTVESEPIRVPAGPPPEVVFSAPTEAETEVSTTTTVRIQFSRDIDPATFKGHIRARYAEQGGGEPPPPPVDVTTQYNGANRVLELRFPKPLERFRTLIVELTEGILGTDQQPLKPWQLKFELGGS